MDSVNVQAFVLGVIFLSAGGYLAFNMQTDTAWSTYSSNDKEEFFDGDFWWTVEVTNEMEIGLNEATISANGKMCDERNCYPIDMGFEFEILDNPVALEERGSPVDCETTDEKYDVMLCDSASAGSTSHAIISTGLGFLGLTILLSIVGVFGYIPGKILKILSSISSVVLFIGPIVWYVLFPDYNVDISAGEEKYRLSKAFYFTLLSSPLVFVGGRLIGGMEAYAYEEDDDWDEEDEEWEDQAYPSYSESSYLSSGLDSGDDDSIDVNLQGVIDGDGYEWLEHPEGSDEWYWRDQETGEWVRY